jgi:hypothetical protein
LPAIVNSRPLKISLLLFGSGLTALIYQVAWMRELRLVFGFSTAASAAVVAIFMGGLGVGSWLLGRRADQAARPLAFYGKLELALDRRAKIYEATGNPRVAVARRELAEFVKHDTSKSAAPAPGEPASFGDRQ